MLALKCGGGGLILLAALIIAPLPASACDMSQSMTVASCANMGFPNVFNNPTPTFTPAPAPPPASPQSAFFDGPYYGPYPADGTFSLFEEHPTMVYPGQPFTCRRGIDCPATLSSLLGSRQPPPIVMLATATPAKDVSSRKRLLDNKLEGLAGRHAAWRALV